MWFLFSCAGDPADSDAAIGPPPLDPAVVGALSMSRVRADVDFLASDANMGRRTPHPGVPSPGYDSAAAYIARRLKELGVKPMGDSGTYFQHYTVTRATLDTTRASGAIDAEALKWGDDFIVNNFLVGGVREANVIYVGNGIRLLKQGVDPYAGFDVKGKWLLVNAPTPAGGRGSAASGSPRAPRWPSGRARSD